MSNRMRKPIESLRCPNINGLPEDVMHTLHHSIVDISSHAKKHRTRRTTSSSVPVAAFESCELLKRLRLEGF